MESKIKIEIFSFGFKYGQPLANFYFDVSFLPNPARLPGKFLTDELDDEMRKYVLQNENTKELITRLVNLIEFISSFDVIKVGVGCNSGRHRSVIVVTEISNRLHELGMDHKVIHRDLF